MQPSARRGEPHRAQRFGHGRAFTSGDGRNDAKRVSESSATITGAFGMLDTACSIISSDVADDADSLHRSTIVCAERLFGYFLRKARTAPDKAGRKLHRCERARPCSAGRIASLSAAAAEQASRRAVTVTRTRRGLVLARLAPSPSCWS